MLSKKRTVIIVEIIMVILAISIFGTFAFLSTSGKQELANTFTAGCLSITIEEEGRAIDLENRYPVTDIEGLEQEGYTFKIKNNCSNDTNYQINLESLSDPTADTTLKADYVRVSLSSDTMDNLITTLKENDVATYHSENAYVSYNLYSGILKGSASKSFTLKEWVEYNTTKEEGASKEYKSQINVVSDTRVEVTPTPEVKFTYSDKKYTGVLTEEASNVKYCMTTDNKCDANKDIEVSNKEITIEAEENDNKQMICTEIENKTYCSNPELIEKVKLCPEGWDACETILANSEIKGPVGTITGPSCNGAAGDSSCYSSDTKKNNMGQNGVYDTVDDYGKTYVFRGFVQNNWLKFGKENGQDIWWRIIRINGNGTIRLIYAGKGSVAPSTKTADTQIGTSTYNTNYNDNKYVGFMFGTASNGSASSEETAGTTDGARNGTKPAHLNKYDSTIKDKLDAWWVTTNLGDTDQVKHIDIETGFCNDREPVKSAHGSYGTTTYGKTQAGYAPADRVWQSGSTSYDSTQEPTLKCGDDTSRQYDLFTGTDAKGVMVDGKTIAGNHALTNPVGLITMDEVIYAGGFAGANNNNYWLYTGQYYWTMSPSCFYNSGSSQYARVFIVTTDGNLNDPNVNSSSIGVRPVINLKADTVIDTLRGGDLANGGTTDNPYIVK